MKVAVTGISDTPPEILDRILGFLHDDHPALHAASLVCREWVPIARRHLFKQTIITERTFGKGTALPFLALAQSEHCTILPAIRSIFLMITDPEVMEDLVQVLALAKAPSQMVYIHVGYTKSISWNANVFPTIHDFTFDTWSTAFEEDVFRLIASFANLDTLVVYITAGGSTITLPPNLSGAPFRNLRTLRLELRPSEELFSWMMNLDGSRFRLETLDLRVLRPCHSGWGSVIALNSFLREISATLNHLSLRIAYYAMFNVDSLINGSHIDLSPLTNLRSIFFVIHDIHTVCDSLASLSSFSSLEVLSLHALRWRDDSLNYHGECDCNFPGILTRFASILDGKHFTELKTLELRVPEKMEFPIEWNLSPKWTRNGALKLTYTTSDASDHQYNSLDSIHHLFRI